MKQIILLTTLLCIVLACKHPKVNCIQPYTKKEIAFIDSIAMRSGTKVELERYSDYDDSTGVCFGIVDNKYHIYIRGEDFEAVTNTDSMRTISKMIATELYKSVLSDPVIYFTPEIEVRISGKPQRKHQEFGNRYSARFKTTDLEKYCGFYIKKTANGFSRKKSETKSDTLSIFQEYILD